MLRSAYIGPTPVSVMFDEPFLHSNQRAVAWDNVPVYCAGSGCPANKTLDFSVFEPINFFPGYDIHNRLPYAEHFNLSIQRELTQIDRADAGVRRDRRAPPDYQQEANPGRRGLCVCISTRQGL